MKKIILILSIIAVVALLSVPISTSVFAAHGKDESFNLDAYTSQSALLLDYDTGTVIVDKNSDEKRPIASMVKIMTLLITFDEIDAGRLSFEEKIIVSEYAAGMGGSQMFLDEGESYTVSDLIKGVTVCSANDAATALGERISGDIHSFVDKMNEYAKNLGMNNTVFCNATGLPNSGEQYSTARDVSIMFSKLLSKSHYYDYSKIWMEEYKHPDGRVTELVNTNKLIRFYKNCDAGKTGYTDEAGHCLAASAMNNGLRVVSVVLGAENSKARFKEVTDLFNYAFANYEVKTIISKGEAIANDLQVDKAKEDSFELYVDRDLKFFSRKNVQNDYEVVIELEENLKAPISKETPLGRVKIIKNGEVVSEANIFSVRDIEKLNYKDALEKVLKNWLF